MEEMGLFKFGRLNFRTKKNTTNPIILEWNEKLETSVSEIDVQHKELFEKINAFFLAWQQGKSKEEILDIIYYIEKYILYHFDTEEKLMHKYKYSDTDRHIEAHSNFVKAFLSIKKQIESSKLDDHFFIHLNFSLISWLTVHYKREDILLAGFLKRVTDTEIEKDLYLA